MSGKIPERQIAHIRHSVDIGEVIGDYVALRKAGSDALSGLCPFHEEKTPSFFVRPGHGHFHCFGCGAGGDVFTFIQDIEHISFTEAAEKLAARLGITIEYEGGGPSVAKEQGTRSRLFAANALAQQFYSERLTTSPHNVAIDFLAGRGFSLQHAQQYGCGYAPEGWDELAKFLLGQGFSPTEIEAAGLAKPGRRGGLIDRFRRRLLWPIKSLTGEVVGFGARKLFDDDPLAKYVNTPETVLYKKSQVLFGLDLAKKHISRAHQVVVVEGYTDVMAMHAAGVSTAVAACGTAFGDGHISLLRRLMLDDSYFRGEVIFTFDGDQAGQAAALKAFASEQKISAQTFISLVPDGLDPCELRQNRGDQAVRDLIAKRIPMFEFAIRYEIGKFDIDTAEGRVAAAKACAQLIARIRDGSLRMEYTRLVAGWLGMESSSSLAREVKYAFKFKNNKPAETPAANQRNSSARQPNSPVSQHNSAELSPDEPHSWPQEEALKVALQYPQYAGSIYDSLPPECFSHPLLGKIHALISDAGGVSGGITSMELIELVLAGSSDPQVKSLINQLSVAPLPVTDDAVNRYVVGVLAYLQEQWVGRQIADLKRSLRQLSPQDENSNYSVLLSDLVALESYRRSLVEQIHGE